MRAKHPGSLCQQAGCRMTPRLSPLMSPRCCHRHDCCYDTAEKEGCNPKVQRYKWACEHNTVQCGKERLAPVRGCLCLPPSLLCRHQADQRALGPQRQACVCQVGFKAALGNVCSLPSSLPIPCQESPAGAGRKAGVPAQPTPGNLRPPQAEEPEWGPWSPQAILVWQGGRGLSGDFLLAHIQHAFSSLASSHSCGSSGVLFPLQFWPSVQQDCPLFYHP